jgi:hypothetical protein
MRNKQNIWVVGLAIALLAGPALAQDKCEMVGAVAANIARHRDEGEPEAHALRTIARTETCSSGQNKHDCEYFKDMVGFIFVTSWAPEAYQAFYTRSCYQNDSGD